MPIRNTPKQRCEDRRAQKKKVNDEKRRRASAFSRAPVLPFGFFVGFSFRSKMLRSPVGAASSSGGAQMNSAYQNASGAGALAMPAAAPPTQGNELLKC